MPTDCTTPNQEAGYCIEIKSCPVLLDQLKNQKAAKFLTESQCGPANENPTNPKVCCGKLGNFRKKKSQVFESSVNRKANQTSVFETVTMNAPNTDANATRGKKYFFCVMSKYFMIFLLYQRLSWEIRKVASARLKRCFSCYRFPRCLLILVLIKIK